MTTIKRNFITVKEMNQINEILLTASKNKQFANDWEIKIPTHLDFWNNVRKNPDLERSNDFLNDLFGRYRIDRLSAYKKVFDFAQENNIDLLSIFDELRVKIPGARFDRYPEYLDFINYVYQKDYFSPNHDFSVYFNKFHKPTKNNIASQVKLLASLDDSKKSFDIYCKLFDSFLTLVPSLTQEDQKDIQKLFLKFQHQDFFTSQATSHQKFYPSLLEVENISEIQEDTYFSKRFCLSASHRVETLAKAIDNSLTFIYNNVFQDLRDKEIVSDFYTFSEQGSFYLYVFTDNEKRLKHIAKAVHAFHEEIQSFLQNNTESEDYYIKLFQTISLAEKLLSNATDLEDKLSSKTQTESTEVKIKKNKI